MKISRIDPVLILLSLLLYNCGQDQVVNVINNDDSYLPKLHWEINEVDGSSEKLDTVYVEPGDTIFARVKIYYTEPEHVRSILIRNELLVFGQGWKSFSHGQLIDKPIDSIEDTLEFNVKVEIREANPMRLQAEIWEFDSAYDQKRYKDLFIMPK